MHEYIMNICHKYSNIKNSRTAEHRITLLHITPVASRGWGGGGGPPRVTPSQRVTPRGKY